MIEYKLFASCIPVKGATRSVICDLQRHSLDIIPNDLFDILDNPAFKSIDDVKSANNSSSHEVIDEYFEFLYRKEYIFFSANCGDFPALNKEWSYPYRISNSIVDLHQLDASAFDVIKQLDDIKCRNVQIRILGETPPDHLRELLEFISSEQMIICHLEVVLPYTEAWFDDVIKDLYLSYPRLISLTFFNASGSKILDPIFQNRGLTKFTSKKSLSCKDCGYINVANFPINIPVFTEALAFNSCLNRKISIDVDGNIKNCPSMQKSFGNIKDGGTFTTAIENPAFQIPWRQNKDNITICKDCEFRYVCTDCRAYLSDPSDPLSKPLKCGYDPYNAQWSDWRDLASPVVLEFYNL